MKIPLVLCLFVIFCYAEEPKLNMTNDLHSLKEYKGRIKNIILEIEESKNVATSTTYKLIESTEKLDGQIVAYAAENHVLRLRQRFQYVSKNVRPDLKDCLQKIGDSTQIVLRATFENMKKCSDVASQKWHEYKVQYDEALKTAKGIHDHVIVKKCTNKIREKMVNCILNDFKKVYDELLKILGDLNKGMLKHILPLINEQKKCNHQYIKEITKALYEGSSKMQDCFYPVIATEL